MEIKNLSNHDNNVTLEIESEGLEWARYLENTSRELQKRQPIPGYRAGKVPLKMAAAKYGNTLFETTASTAAQELLNKACEENNLAPVSTPVINIIASDMDRLSVIYSFANYPEVKELNWRDLHPVKPVKTCSEADVDEAIDKYMHQHLYVHEVPREARMGDIVEVSFRGTSEGKSFAYDHSDKSRFTMGSGQLFAGLDEALLGHVGGDDLELSLTMPEDFHRQDVAGMTLDLQIHLRGVWARDLLECTDEYVKENVKNCETLAEFREQQREKIQSRYDSESERIYAQNLDKALADAITVPVPEAMIRTALDRYVATLRSLAAQQGKTAEQMLDEEGKDMAQFIEQCRPSAEMQVRKSIAIDYVIETEHVELTQEEVNNYVSKFAAANKLSVEQAVDYITKTGQGLDELVTNKAGKLVENTVVPEIVEVDEFPKTRY